MRNGWSVSGVVDVINGVERPTALCSWKAMSWNMKGGRFDTAGNRMIGQQHACALVVLCTAIVMRRWAWRADPRVPKNFPRPIASAQEDYYWLHWRRRLFMNTEQEVHQGTPLQCCCTICINLRKRVDREKDLALALAGFELAFGASCGAAQWYRRNRVFFYWERLRWLARHKVLGFSLFLLHRRTFCYQFGKFYSSYVMCEGKRKSCRKAWRYSIRHGSLAIERWSGQKIPDDSGMVMAMAPWAWKTPSLFLPACLKAEMRTLRSSDIRGDVFYICTFWNYCIKGENYGMPAWNRLRGGIHWSLSGKKKAAMTGRIYRGACGVPKRCFC